MRYRRFGRTGWEVSEIGYGLWGMTGWTGSDDDESQQALSRAVELGCNFFDTAWAYGDGRSERLLGELLRSYPDRRLYVASKIPQRTSSGRPGQNTPWTIAIQWTTLAHRIQLGQLGIGDHARACAAFHLVEPGRNHNHSGDAQEQPRRRESGSQRCWPAFVRIRRSIEAPPLGPGAR